MENARAFVGASALVGAISFAIAFVLNVALVALDAPLAARPFYWTSQFVLHARAAAAALGDWVGRVYVFCAYYASQFVEKLGPAFRTSARDAAELALVGFYMARDYATHLFERLRASEALAYLVSPYAVMAVTTLAAAALAALLVAKLRPAWWAAFTSLFAASPPAYDPTVVVATAVAQAEVRDRNLRASRGRA